MPSTLKKKQAYEKAPEAQTNGKVEISTTFIFGDIRMDILHRILFVGEKQIPLTAGESMILYTLLQSIGGLVRRETLFEAAGTQNSDRALESTVYRLRRKLQGTGYKITLKRGRGYVFERV